MIRFPSTSFETKKDLQLQESVPTLRKGTSKSRGKRHDSEIGLRPDHLPDGASEEYGQNVSITEI